MEVRAYGNSPTIGTGSGVGTALRPASSKGVAEPIVQKVPESKKKVTKITKKSSKTTKSKVTSRSSLKKASKDTLDEILDKQTQIVPQNPTTTNIQDIDNLLRNMDPQEMAKDKAFKEIAFIFDTKQYQGDVHYSRDGDAGFYTQENEKKRAALKSNQMIIEAINSVVDVYTFERDGTLTKPNYIKVNVCLAKILRQDLKETPALRIVEEDWKHDSKGKNTITKQEVFDSLFELGDMWTPDVDAYQYVVFYEKLQRLLKGKDELPNSNQKVAVTV